MRSKWLKLASLAQNVCIFTLLVLWCTLCLDRIPFINTNDINIASDKDCVVAVERFPVLHYNVDFIILSFGIMDSIVEL